MTLKCDHCRRRLGARIHRYWQMRFCSPACVAAYQRRLDHGTRMKIDRLDYAAPPARASDWRWLGGLIRCLPG